MKEEEVIIEREIDIKKFSADVHGTVGKNITSDWVLAQFAEQTKEPMIQLGSLARYIRSLLVRHSESTENWKWNKEGHCWETKELTKEQKRRVNEAADSVYETYMNKLNMRSILNRNVEKNPLLFKIITTESKQEEPEVPTMERDQIHER